MGGGYTGPCAAEYWFDSTHCHTAQVNHYITAVLQLQDVSLHIFFIETLLLENKVWAGCILSVIIPTTLVSVLLGPVPSIPTYFFNYLLVAFYTCIIIAHNGKFLLSNRYNIIINIAI